VADRYLRRSPAALRPAVVILTWNTAPDPAQWAPLNRLNS